MGKAGISGNEGKQEMNREIIRETGEIIGRMDRQLGSSLLPGDGEAWHGKMWENTYIKKQIDRRSSGHTDFTLQEHIRAMVYSMLGSGIAWERVGKYIDRATGRITVIDDIFHQYDPGYLLSCQANDLAGQIKRKGCSGYSTWKQMDGLIHTNIRKLAGLQEKYGSIDRYYRKFMEKDPSMKLLVRDLACPSSEDKYVQMGVPLVAEYLRNIGYDLAKPDRHIRRILGKDYLGCRGQEEIPAYGIFDLVRELSESMGRKTVAEVDYILWAYCAEGYGGVCRKGREKCRICVAGESCRHGWEGKRAGDRDREP